MLTITLENLTEKIQIAKQKAKMAELKNKWAISSIDNIERMRKLPDKTREEMLRTRLSIGIYDGDNQPTVTDKELAFEYQLSINLVRALIDFNRVEEREMEPLYGDFDDNGYYLKEVI